MLRQIVSFSVEKGLLMFVLFLLPIKVIKGRQENLSGVLEIGNFEANRLAYDYCVTSINESIYVTALT